MSRAANGTVSRRRSKKVLRMAKGFRSVRSVAFRKARESVEKGLSYAYRDRRARKRDFRRLWIARINAAVRADAMTYSQFMYGLKISVVFGNVLRNLGRKLSCRFRACLRKPHLTNRQALSLLRFPLRRWKRVWALNVGLKPPLTGRLIRSAN